MKKIIYLLFILLILSSIFFFSSKNSNESNGLSKKLINNTINIVEKVTHKDLDNKELVNTLNYPIRKLAHFTIFLLLGISIFLFISTFNINKKVLISILVCILFASLDEFHQVFSLGRSPLLLDILIDSLGSITGITSIRKIINSKQKNI